MNPTELFSVVLVFLHCNVEIGCLEITLERLAITCLYRIECYKNAIGIYQARGSIVHDAGDQLPPYFRVERLCPPSTTCASYNGNGLWQQMRDVRTSYCHTNLTNIHDGCYLLSERSYGFYIRFYTIYSNRMCKVRVHLCDRRSDVDSCVRVSNELNVSDILTNTSYGYNTSMDVLTENRCMEAKRSQAFQDENEGNRHPSDDFLMIFGAVLAINMIVFC